jgi:hypothetical protein
VFLKLLDILLTSVAEGSELGIAGNSGGGGKYSPPMVQMGAGGD